MASPATSPCDTCDARCCSAYAVHLSGDDAWRLATGTGLSLEDFISCARQPDPSRIGFALEPGGPAHDLLLARADVPGAQPACLFLEPREGGPPRCGVYPFRPRACRRFPASRLGGGYGVRAGLVCPPGAWAGHDMGRLSWRVAMSREEREWETYGAVVAAWGDRLGRGCGRAPPNVLHFLDYLEEAYAWLARWRASLRPEERAGEGYRQRIRATLGAC